MALATTTTIGSVRLGGDLGGNNDPLNPQLPATGVTPGVYTNPVVTVNTKGLVTNISSGSAIDIFAVPMASPSVAGVAKYGDGFTVATDGTVTLPVASSAVKGVVMIGNGINVTAAGLISVDTSLFPSIANGAQYTGAIVTVAVDSPNTSGTKALDFSKSNTFNVALVGPTTLAKPTNIIAGGTYFITLRQDATGSRTVTFDSTFKFEAGADKTVSTTPNAVDILRLTVISDTEIVAKLYKNFV